MLCEREWELGLIELATKFLVDTNELVMVSKVNEIEMVEAEVINGNNGSD